MSKIALYLRLSVDEASADESNSITNQRVLLNQYLDRIPEFHHFQRIEFTDDGFSGKNPNRPAFNRLMSDVNSGKIRFIIVKDFSRFMRDYLELGNYIENIFPFLGVRFIAINDQFDSLTTENNGVDIDVPFRNLLNDFYARDVSEKVKSVMNTMKRSGKNMSWLPPFGYLKDPNDRFNIIIDKSVAPIIRRIFQMCIQGFSLSQIAMKLNDENTITPAERKGQISQANYNYQIISTKTQKRNIWTRSTVSRILKNEAYKGTYLFNIKTMVNGKQVKQPMEKWERIENNHEAIVTSDMFEQAKNALKIRSNYSSEHGVTKKHDIILTGFLICEHCGHKLTAYTYKIKTRHYFYCRYCMLQGYSFKGCRSDRVEQEILFFLKSKIQVKPSPRSNQSITRAISLLKSQKFSYFQDYKAERINREKYILLKKEIEKKIGVLENELNNMNPRQPLIGDSLTKEVLRESVKQIMVNRVGDYRIDYKNI